MSRIYTTLFLILVTFIVIGQKVEVNNLLCNNRHSPLGIDYNPPLFSWQIITQRSGFRQTACQLLLSNDYLALKMGKGNVWSSGKISGSQSINLHYSGNKLLPATRYYWAVKLWDENGKDFKSGIDSFTTALFEIRDWNNAQWIGYEELPDSMRIVPGVHSPLVKKLGSSATKRSVVPLFRKEFRIEKKIKHAWLFVTGLGHYEVNINGKKVGNAFLSPGWTHYDKTVLYNTYEVTEKLKKGQNAIGAIVGNGFYNINRERYFKLVTAFGFPKMICRLMIIYEDSVVENIVSDATWRVTPSPITYSSIFGGEDYDARLEQNGWDTAGFIDSNWRNAITVKTPVGKLMPEQDYPVVFKDSFDVKRSWSPAANIYGFDFGQNISGIVRLKVKGKKGQVIKLIPAELLNKELLANQAASGSPQYFSYTLKGEEEEIWQPKFTYYGFRYVQVEGASPDSVKNDTGLPVVTGLTALHNRNSNPENGSFECSNELFNRIYTLINWAIKSNMQSVITDCPHREKLSWLEQDYLMGPSIHYNYDIYQLYRKLVFDLMDAQYEKGFVPDIAPEFVVFEGGFLDSPEWGSAAVILPWLLYTWYGDLDIMQRAYPMMKKYVAYLENKSTNHILSHGLGDWYDYGPKPPGEAQLTPKAVTATSIYYYDVMLLSKMAGILKMKNDEVAFQKQALLIKQSFNKEFFNATTKVYSTGSQTAMSMPLCVGLVDELNKKDVLKNLVDSIYAGNKALTAGDIGFHFLIAALDEGGASQLIFDMNNREDVPGYGFQLKKGATALTESWPALEEVSNNHLMLGHIMEWFYSGLAGISQEENSIAFNHIKIRPQPVGNITSAKGKFHSPYGLISTDWKKESLRFLLQIQIPANTKATVYLPAMASSKIYMNGELINGDKFKIIAGAAIIETGSGEYNFEVLE